MSTSSPGEANRLNALYRYNILDTLPEEKFDRITRLATHCLDAPIALVTLVDDDRQWFKSCVGLDVRETEREHSFCAHNLNGDSVMIIEDTTTDPRFAENPLVTGPTHVRFYAGAPLLTPDGYVLGSLCVLDTTPRSATSLNETVLKDLADTVVTELELRLANNNLRDRNRHIQSLTQELKAANETDRSQLSHLLQEELQQLLQAARMHLERVRPQTKDRPRTADPLEHITTALNDALDLTHRLAARFAPPVANQPLPDTLQWLAEKMKADHGLSVSIHGRSSDLGADETLNPLIYQVVRELLFRLAKAPGPTTVQVGLTNFPDHLRITVENNHNIDPTQPATDDLDDLAYLQTKIEALGTPIHIQSGPDACVTIEVPRLGPTNGSSNGTSLSRFVPNSANAPSESGSRTFSPISSPVSTD